MTGLFQDELQQVVLSLCTFSLPALVYAASVVVSVPERLRWLLPGFVLLAPLGYWWLTRQESHASRTGDARTTEEYRPMESPLDPATSKAELVSTNYEQLNEHAKYRDKLLINANYFSLAIVAVLVNVFLRTGVELRPLIAMVGAVTAYAFWLATRSYKGTRDAINDEMRAMEDKQYAELNVVSTYDTRERTPIEKRSLSSYLVGIQIVASLLWTGVYFGYVLYLSLGIA